MNLLDRSEEDPPTFNKSWFANGTDVANSSCSPIHESVRIAFMVFYSLVFVVGLILNGFTLKVFLCRPQRTSRSVSVYLRNLVAADFFISLSLPLRVAFLSSSSASVQKAYCSFGASAFYLNMYASILFMFYIAANRHLKIIHPLRTQVLQTVRVAHVVSTVTWGVLLSMATTYFLVSLLASRGVSQQSDSSTLRCDTQQSRPVTLMYKIVNSIPTSFFLLVLGFLVFFYASISRKLSQAQRRQLASRKLAKSRRNMLVLVVVFCLCFVPYHLVRLPYVFRSKTMRCSEGLFYLKETATALSVLNVCFDPLIYFIFCEAFKSHRSTKGSLSSIQAATNAERRSSDIPSLRRISVQHSEDISQS